MRFLASLPMRSVEKDSRIEHLDIPIRPDISVEGVSHDPARIPAAWISGPSHESAFKDGILNINSKCAIYLHGGGYCASSVSAYKGWIARFSKLLDVPILGTSPHNAIASQLIS